MATPTINPPGWYADPTGRHQSRYWDNDHWTDRVSDGGVMSVEPGMAVPAMPAMPMPMPAMPMPAMPAQPPPFVPVPEGGFRAVAIPPWRAAALRLALVALAIAFFFEVVASFALGRVVGSATYSINPPSRSTFTWAAWLFHYEGSGRITYAYPPLLIWPALFAGYALAASLLVQKVSALAKAGCRARWAWSAKPERARLGAALRGLGCASTLLRERGRVAMVVCGEIAAVLAAIIAGYAVTAREGLMQKSSGLTFTGDLTVGWGPKVCLVAALIALVTLPMGLPWRSDRRVVIRQDGSVTTEG